MKKVVYELSALLQQKSIWARNSVHYSAEKTMEVMQQLMKDIWEGKQSREMYEIVDILAESLQFMTNGIRLLQEIENHAKEIVKEVTKNGNNKEESSDS